MALYKFRIINNSSSSVDRWMQVVDLYVQSVVYNSEYRTSTKHYYDFQCTIYRPSSYNEPLGFPKGNSLV